MHGMGEKKNRDPLIRGASLLSQVGSALTWAEFLQFAFQFGNCESSNGTPLRTMQ